MNNIHATRTLYRVFCSLALFLGILLASFTWQGPNWYFGRNRQYVMYTDPVPPMYAPMKARVLEKTFDAPKDLLDYNFLQQVGGVAFQCVAQPGENFPAGRLSCIYNKKKPDGQRLSLVAGKDTLVAELYDWQLVPIAKYADSRFQACMSMFGPESAEHAYHIVFHQAFMNTLLGTRLLHCDALFFDLFEFWKLPEFGNEQILGAGESVGEMEIALQAARTLNSVFNTEAHYQAYVLTDADVDVRIGRKGQNLTLTGEPYYYFWTSDRAVFVEKRNRIVLEANAIMEQINRTSDSIANQSLPYAERLKLNDHRNDLILKYNQKIEAANALKPEVIPLINLIWKMKDQKESLEKFSPAVYAAARNTMQFSALFRYAKQHNPTDWSRFLRSLEKVIVQPTVKTPVSWGKS
ncbi:MAG: hypothetical protein JNJ90_19130 [Saprospiraceae bacterium]|jgi:hypothetical protein|nr:hypothetical protein [Saprospiraceae bacterium]